MKGQALDLDADVYGRVTNAEIFYYIKENLDFDQMIWEGGTEQNPNWVHVSFNAGKNRGSLLRMYKVNGKSAYKVFDLWKTSF